jgi:hypothetical protein
MKPEARMKRGVNGTEWYRVEPWNLQRKSSLFHIV